MSVGWSTDASEAERQPVGLCGWIDVGKSAAGCVYQYMVIHGRNVAAGFFGFLYEDAAQHEGRSYED